MQKQSQFDETEFSNPSPQNPTLLDSFHLCFALWIKEVFSSLPVFVILEVHQQPRTNLQINSQLICKQFSFQIHQVFDMFLCLARKTRTFWTSSSAGRQQHGCKEQFPILTEDLCLTLLKLGRRGTLTAA